MSYDELVNYINTDPDVMNYPSRRATIFNNSHQVAMLLELDKINERDNY
jgi:hypothetical protein